ncbi:MAG: caspase family protein [Cyanobacteria bacterium HKST-UBA02]|nr:caspase family protein [Cyanobacteria bacterium HKST-UBA02]
MNKFVHLILSTLIVLAAAAPGLAAESESEPGKRAAKPIRDKWALIVGISEFKNKSIPSLKFASKDARDFYNYLIKEANFAPDHVRLLTDKKATRRRVMSELGSKFLAPLARPDDLVVLFFSTHGSPSSMDLRGDNYLVAYDSDPDDLYVSGIEMKKIIESISDRVFTNRVLLVLDACHSGAIKPDAKGLKRSANFNAEELAQGSGQLVICSSMPDEQSWESRRFKNGVFTRRLLEGLKSNGTYTRLGEAFEEVKGSVQNEVREDRKGARQTPVLHSAWDGEDLILAARPFDPQSIPGAVAEDLEPDSTAINTESAAENSPNSLPDSPAGEKTAGGSLIVDKSYFAEEGDPKNLIKSYTVAIRNDPKDPELFYRRGCAFIQLGDWMRALNDFCDAQMNTPNKAHFYIGRAYVYHKLNRPIDARSDLKDAQFYDKKLPPQISFGD